MKLNLDMDERKSTAVWNLAEYYKDIIKAATELLRLNLNEMHNFLEETNIVDEMTEKKEEQWEQLCANVLLRTLMWQDYIEMLDKTRKHMRELYKEGHKNGAAAVSAGAGGEDPQ